MNKDIAEETKDILSAQIVSQIAFQRRWRMISMSGYSITTVGSLTCSAGATVCAGLSMNALAAVLAATATVLLGTEKALLFREKWKFHLLMHVRLMALQSQLELLRIPVLEAVDSFNAIMNSYANELPMAGRDADR